MQWGSLSTPDINAISPCFLQCSIYNRCGIPFIQAASVFSQWDGGY